MADDQVAVAEPEVKPVEEAQPVTDTQPDTQPDPETNPEDGTEHENHDTRRMHKFIAEAAAARREAEIYKQMLEDAANPPEETQEVQRPTRDKFNNDEDYVLALADWRFDQRKAEFIADTKAENQHQAVTTAWNAKVAQATQTHPDFNDVIQTAGATMVIPEPIRAAFNEAILTSESGPEIQYYLAKNPSVFNAITKLSSSAAAREIGKLEARLQTKPSDTTVPVTSAAPAPIKPVSGRATPAKSINDPNISMEDFMRIRREQLKNRNRR